MEPIGFGPVPANRQQRRASKSARRGDANLKQKSLEIVKEYLVEVWEMDRFDELINLFLFHLQRVPQGYDRFVSGGFAELAKAKADEAVNSSESLSPGLSLSDLQCVIDCLVARSQGVTDADDLSPVERAESLKAYFSQLPSK